MAIDTDAYWNPFLETLPKEKLRDSKISENMETKMDAPNPKKMCRLITQLRETSLELKSEGKGIQAVERNVGRILASIRMLELNVCDITDPGLFGKIRKKYLVRIW